ncbi:hypothetical protein E2C01_085014 [Portunus trituberculatus]|uniref:Uncharacterized protein n=1 Tax=Portunus trituberculatus TaxID=210409 RepID=A0A5B7J9B4_PORTR|nr:hypothetical protein [Portunus trituberculatus]
MRSILSYLSTQDSKFKAILSTHPSDRDRQEEMMAKEDEECNKIAKETTKKNKQQQTFCPQLDSNR